MNKSSKGFTLIELLVVIAIIGILSSVVLASLNSARRKGRDARRVSDVKQLQLALELSYDANGTYPAAVSTTTIVTPGYMPAIPMDPTTLAAYPFEQLSSGTSYVVAATLEDTNNSALDADLDGTVGTTNCADPVYCVQP
jgi:general secretion pathway protein G